MAAAEEGERLFTGGSVKVTDSFPVICRIIRFHRRESVPLMNGRIKSLTPFACRQVPYTGVKGPEELNSL